MLYISRIKKILSQISDSLKKKVYMIIDHMPTKEIIVLECESDMDDNPRAFYEYLLSRGWNLSNKSHKIIWVVNDVDFCKKNYAAQNVFFINRNSRTLLNRIRMKYYFAIAGYFVFSHPYWFKKLKSGQVVFNTGHGTPIKDASKTDDPNIEKSYDWRIIPTEAARPWIIREGCPSNKLLICGYPRSDELFVGNKQEIMSSLFEFHPDEKVLICMPTYKRSVRKMDSIAVDIFSLDVINSEEEYKTLNDFLKTERVHLIIKPHPLQLVDGLRIEDKSNIHYINNRVLLEKHIIFYRLLGCCDGLITDLSSVIYDYLLLDRPIGLLTRNYDKYTRGFMVDNILDFLPGTQIENYSELLSFIKCCVEGDDIHSEKRQMINRLVNKLPAGHYCEEFYDIVFSKDRLL